MDKRRNTTIYPMKKKLNVKIKITKNIPCQAGLGSASTDAASLIKGLQKLDLINGINNQFLSIKILIKVSSI